MATQFKRDPVVDYIAQNAITQAETQTNRLQVVSQLSAIQDATSEQIAGVKAYGDAMAMVSSATEGFKAETDFANAKAKADLGLDPRAANYRLTELAQTQKTAYDNTQAIAKTILEKQQATIFDDPIGWISNQFTLPADIATHNYYAAQHNSAEDEFKSIVDAGTKVGQETRALEATTSAAKAQGELGKIAAEAHTKIGEIKRQGAQLQLSGIKELQNLTDADLTHAAQMVSVKEAEDRAALARAQFAATQEQRAYMNEERNKKLQEGKMVEADEIQMTEAFNAAGAADGFAPRSRSAVVAAVKRNDPSAVMAINRGYNLLQNNGNKSGVLVARSAADAADYYKKLNVVPKGTDASVINFIATQLTGLEAQPQVAAIKEPDVKRQAVNQAIVSVATEQMKAIKDNEPNIYAAPPVASVVTLVPALAKNKFITEVLLPQSAANPTAPTSIENILGAAVATVDKDPTQLNEVVAGVANFFNASIAANNKLKAYAENGLPLQKDFNASISSGFLGRKNNVDVSDPLQIRAYLLSNSDSIVKRRGTVFSRATTGKSE